MTVTILQGDCRERLREMVAGSVHATITSPPYWGLRDYGLPPSVWGGDEGCVHEWGDESRRVMTGGGVESSTLGVASGGHGMSQEGHQRTLERSHYDASQGQFCRLCGCWKGALGLEPRVDMYIAHLVEVMRGVKRVLRDDGTVFLNLGSSYASGGMNPNPSPHVSRVPAYGSDGIERSDLQETDRVCPRCGGVRQGDSRNHPRRIVHTGPSPRVDALPLSQIDRDSVPLDCGQASLGASVPDAQESSIPALPDCGQDASVHEATVSVCLCEHDLSLRESQASAHMGQNRHDTSLTLPTSDCHTRDKEFSYSASDTSYQEPIALTLLYSTIKALNVKPKDLLMIPSWVALALQADGWYLRSDIIWAKGLSFCPTYSGSVMPESCRDRPTSAYEHVFLLAKGKRYYYDNEAVRENFADERMGNPGPYNWAYGNRNGGGVRGQGGSTETMETQGWNKAGTHSGRNLRNVWAINPAGFPGAHFATFPPKLIEPMIKAGTSERGCCPSCGSPWTRIVVPTGHINKREPAHCPNNCGTKTDSTGWAPTTIATENWRPGCDCVAGMIQPCTVLDPFGGAGTTALVARSLGRDAILIELNPDYCEMARRRLDGTEEIETTNGDGDVVTMEQAVMFGGVTVE